MGLQGLVAHNEDEYVDLTVRLVRDEEYRRRVREQIVDSRSVLFNDLSSVRALEAFLKTRHGQGRRVAVCIFWRPHRGDSVIGAPTAESTPPWDRS